MNKKLTLSINQIVIENAKKYAKSRSKSLSSIVEEYLKSLSVKEDASKKKASLKLVKELKGSVKVPKKLTSKKEILEDALLEKYVNR